MYIHILDILDMCKICLFIRLMFCVCVCVGSLLHVHGRVQIYIYIYIYTVYILHSVGMINERFPEPTVNIKVLQDTILCFMRCVLPC